MMRAKGEGSIYQRGDGKWVAQVDAGVNLETGRRRYRRRVRGSKQGASRALTDLRREAGIPAAVEGITVGAWCDEFIRDCGDRVRAGAMAPRTAIGYESDVRNHIRPHLGDIRLDKLSPGHVARMMTAMQAAGFKARTAGAARGTLSAALSAAMADGLLERNVARAAKPPPRDPRNPSAFSEKELDAIVEAAHSHRLGNLFIFSVLTGLRTSEVIGLRWVDVDLDDASYQVVEGLHRIGSTGAKAIGIEPGLVASQPKTVGSGARTPMSPAAVAVLKRQRKQQVEERLASPGWVESGAVFATANGQQLDPSNVRKEWYRLLEGSGVSVKSASGAGRGLHELRRTFASRMRDLGVPLEEVQKLGRWASPQMLLSHYRAVDDQRLRTAVGQGDGDRSW